jgi:phosphatidylglycerol:prolipoprotein diacylglycerol transferase
MLDFWQNIYSNFNPVAFELFSISVHWYGIMYATALLVAIYMGHYIIKLDKSVITKNELDDYIIWVEVGVILGARIGYVIFYDLNASRYISEPWQIFNPMQDGQFVGISGMSYHGALIGFIIAAYIFSVKRNLSFWKFADIASLAVPLGYTFGRIGNFVNQELVGRQTDLPWGIYVNNMLRHPSALYEAFLEGIVIFIILFWYRKKAKFDGQIALLYVILYSLMRIVAENFRQPDIQLGFLLGTSWLTMGIFISLGFSLFGIFVYSYLLKKATR